MRDSIKKILREETSKKRKFTDVILKDLYKEFAMSGVVRSFNRPPQYSYSDLMGWMSQFGDNHTKSKFGLSGENDYEMLGEIRNEFYATILGLPKIGSRIRLIKMEDAWTKLKEGDEGVVLGYNPTPWGDTLMMRWDSGSSLDIDPNEDEYEVLS